MLLGCLGIYNVIFNVPDALQYSLCNIFHWNLLTDVDQNLSIKYSFIV